MGNLAGKYALVTGAAKGLGKAIAQRFLEDGVDGVAVVDYDIETLNKTAAQLGEKAFAVRCDVSDEASVQATVDAVMEKYGRIDILVNNAGITSDAMLAKMTTEQWNRVLSVDLNSVFYFTQRMIPIMKAQNYGKIINVSSLAAFGNVGQGNYAAAKAGVLGLTKTSSRELARYNVTVNAICPSLINTDIIKTVPEKVMQNILKQVPADRVGEPEEVAGVVSFLASDDSSFVTGEVIRVAGGAVL